MSWYSNIVKRIERLFFGDFDRVLLTGAIALILAFFAYRIVLILIILWIIYIEYRLWKKSNLRAKKAE